MLEREAVVNGVAEKVEWWISARRKKLEDLSHSTHAVNPFLWPVIMSMHHFSSFRELADFQLAGHLVEGHATGFGKLIDEKVLEDVFGTTKLDKAFRESSPGFDGHIFDNVDHVVHRDGRSPDLLSLKAGRWSIQLGQAVQLNRSFQGLLAARESGEVDFGRIVVGVFYGTEGTLGDKYRIIRGLPTRAEHDTEDISSEVDVYAGRPFWSWLNDGERSTQEWVLEGILSGCSAAAPDNEQFARLYEEFVEHFAASFAEFETSSGIDWRALLRTINS